MSALEGNNVASSAQDAYLESRILTADPVELVRILYATAIGRVREAREHMQKGDVAARAKALSVAARAIFELNCSLDHEAGGEMSQRLAQLYEYIDWRLIEANIDQRVEPLNEVLGLLTTLAEAWQTMRSEPSAPSTPAVGPRWVEEPSTETVQYASQSWSG